MHAAIAAWKRQSEERKLREECFDLTAPGSAIPPAEMASHAVKRAKGARSIPDYDPRSDPHLVGFWRDKRRRASHERKPHQPPHAASRGAAGSGVPPVRGVQQAGAALMASRPGTSGDSRSGSPRAPPIAASSTRLAADSFGLFSVPVSADHVLALKNVFYRYSQETQVATCRAAVPAAQSLSRTRSPVQRKSSAAVARRGSVSEATQTRHGKVRRPQRYSSSSGSDSDAYESGFDTSSSSDDDDGAPGAGVGGGCMPHDDVRRMERPRLVSVHGTNMHAVVVVALGISNHHRKLTGHGPLPTNPSMELLYEWLTVLGCGLTVDWPSFMLLARCDIIRDLGKVRQLRDAYDAFQRRAEQEQQRQQKKQPKNDRHGRPQSGGPELGETTEDLQRSLLQFLQRAVPASPPAHHGLHAPPPAQPGDPLQLATFFQSGDFLRPRHVCSFADTLFSLTPHRVQFYLSKANARGLSMNTNYRGHCPVTAAGVRAESSRRAPSPEYKVRPLPRPDRAGLLLSHNQKAESTRGIVRHARKRNGVWA